MRRFLSLTLLFPFLLNAQSVSLDLVKSSSSFIYKESNGDRLDNLSNKRGNTLNVKYTHPLSNKFGVGLGLERNEYGSQYLDSDNHLSWDISYFGINLDFDYTFDLLKNSIKDSTVINNHSLSAVINTGFSDSWLIKGMQQVDNIVYDLKEFDGNFNNLIKVQIGVGLLYGLDEKTSFSLKYAFHRGLNNMETDDQKLYLFAHHILFGIVIDFKK